MSDLLVDWVLLPALVSTLPGWLACHQRRVASGILLIFSGFVAVATLSLCLFFFGFLTKGAFPLPIRAEVIVWGSALLVCVMAGAFVVLTRPRATTRTNAQ